MKKTKLSELSIADLMALREELKFYSSKYDELTGVEGKVRKNAIQDEIELRISNINFETK